MKIDRNRPLPAHTKYKYEECFAKIILEHLFPQRYIDLKIEDIFFTRFQYRPGRYQ